MYDKEEKKIKRRGQSARKKIPFCKRGPTLIVFHATRRFLLSDLEKGGGPARTLVFPKKTVGGVVLGTRVSSCKASWPIWSRKYIEVECFSVARAVCFRWFSDGMVRLIEIDFNVGPE